MILARLSLPTYPFIVQVTQLDDLYAHCSIYLWKYNRVQTGRRVLFAFRSFPSNYTIPLDVHVASSHIGSAPDSNSETYHLPKIPLLFLSHQKSKLKSSKWKWMATLVSSYIFNYYYNSTGVNYTSTGPLIFEQLCASHDTK